MAAEHTPYLNLLKRRYEDEEELRAAAGKVETLVNTEAWRILNEIVQEAHEAYTKDLLLGRTAIKGPVPSQAEYARAVGFLAGVMQSQTAAESFALELDARRRANQSPE